MFALGALQSKHCFLLFAQAQNNRLGPNQGPQGKFSNKHSTGISCFSCFAPSLELMHQVCSSQLGLQKLPAASFAQLRFWEAMREAHLVLYWHKVFVHPSQTAHPVAASSCLSPSTAIPAAHHITFPVPQCHTPHESQKFLRRDKTTPTGCVQSQQYKNKLNI